MGLDYFECVAKRDLVIGLNISACNNYFPLHTVMCYSYYNTHTNIALNKALTIYEGGGYLDTHLFGTVHPGYLLSYHQVFQSSTEVLIVVKYGTYIRCDRYCITSNCNKDISTCAAGFNFDCTGSSPSISEYSDRG